MNDEEFCWINAGQMAKWGKADRPEGGTWSGTVHREHCSMLGDRRLRLDLAEVCERRLQSCVRCGGDGRPLGEPGAARLARPPESRTAGNPVDETRTTVPPTARTSPRSTPAVG